jgi:hypothetical protein
MNAIAGFGSIRGARGLTHDVGVCRPEGESADGDIKKWAGGVSHNSAFMRRELLREWRLRRSGVSAAMKNCP